MLDSDAPAETEAARKRRSRRILRQLDRDYPQAECALRHSSAWELLAATILSAQCTDVRVNKVTPDLFAAYPTVADMAEAPLESIEDLIRTTGFFRNKAKSLKGAARRIVTEYGGQVPSRMEQLLTLPGVARKTANVVTGTWFGKATGVVVDELRHLRAYELVPVCREGTLTTCPASARVSDAASGDPWA